MMKVGVSTYSFGKYVAELGMIGVLDKIKEFEGEAVDFIPFEKDDQEKALALAAEYKAHMDKIGLLPGCFCVPANFLAEDLNAQVKDLCLKADIAKVLGTKMRFDVANGFPANVKVKRSYDSFLESGAVDYIRQVVDYAESIGVETCTENHGIFSQDSERVEKLINVVDRDNFGALVDIGNFACADEPSDKAVGRMAQYARHAHAKDFHYRPGYKDFPGEGWFTTRNENWLKGTVIGHGDVPIKQCLRILKRNGYDGILAIEFEGKEDPLFGVRVGIANLKRFVNEIYQ